MITPKIIVVGSTNMDMVIKTDHIPIPGETVLSGAFFMNPGGKGANQAVAVARLGGNVTFVSKLGNDLFGKQFSRLFEEEGINTSFVVQDDDLPSGVALITVDRVGENSIVVASGANAHLFPADIQAALPEIDRCAIVLLQLEIPMETVEYVIDYAASRNIKVILNPAPANILSPLLLQKIDVLTPNKNEAAMLAGIEVTDIDSAREAAKIIHAKGVKTVVVTMGSLGAVICRHGECALVAAPQVETIDTTAAGDVFNGALCVALAEDKDMISAVAFACEAAAISVTRLGAQSSIPTRTELVSRWPDAARQKTDPS